MTGGSNLLRRGRWRGGCGVNLGKHCLGSRYHRHFLFPGVLKALLSLRALPWRHPVLCGPRGVYLGAIGDEGLQLWRELLYSSLSFSFGLCGIGRLPLRLNDSAICHCLFPLGYCFLSFVHRFFSLNQCLLARIQLGLALSQLCFNRRVLLLT